MKKRTVTKNKKIKRRVKFIDIESRTEHDEIMLAIGQVPENDGSEHDEIINEIISM